MQSNSVLVNVSQKWLIFLLAVTLFVWGAVFFSSIVSAAEIWYESEIFTHGFFVLPISVYLIWRQKSLWFHKSFSPNFWILIPLIGVLFVGLIGDLSRINVFSHFAAFTSLSLIACLLMGNQFALINWFPLAFVLFAIPVGEELVPWLQQITADMALWLMSFTGIPTFNTGLYIEIPEGKFHVAEACSGIRFFIGSLVFGSLYGFISYKSLKKRILFFIVSAIVPIIANALRVFGIILIGHFSDMKHAVGADHLVYGWFFFAIVLLLLIMIGESFRSATDKVVIEQPLKSRVLPYNLIYPALVISIAALSAFAFWRNYAVNVAEAYEVETVTSEISEIMPASDGWSPHLPGHSEAKQIVYFGVDARKYRFNGFSDDGELVSSVNRLYDASKWSLLSKFKELVRIEGNNNRALEVMDIVSETGRKRLLISWYQLDGRPETNALKVKLSQAKNLILGNDAGGSIVIVSQSYSGKTNSFALNNLKMFIEQNISDLVEIKP